MIKIKVVAVAKCKEEWLKMAIAEYERRLKPRLTFEWVYLQDDAQLIRYLSTESDYIALEATGESLGSIEFSRRLEKVLEQNGSRAVFVIGGPEGLPPLAVQNAQLRWSLSPLTFTHQLVRIVLVEQIYRALEIMRNSPYHK